MRAPQNLLVVHPGASCSTADVHTGLLSGLSRQPGVNLAVYDLGGRLAMQGAFLDLMYRRAKKHNPDTPQPSPTDMVKRASRDLPDAIWKHQADWLIVVSGMYVHPDMFATLRWFGKPKTGLLLTESPYDDERQMPIARFADVVWTNERTSVAPLQAVNPATYYLPHAYNAAVHVVNEPDPAVPAHDVVFVGTLFQERIDILEAVDWAGLGINLGIYGNTDYVGKRSKLRPFIKGGPIDNGYAVDLYRRAKIGLNLYRKSMGWGKDAQRIETSESLNPRAVELAACGCFTVSDYRPEVADVFGDLVPTFGDVRELAPLLARWLVDDAGRAAVAAQLPAAVAPHSWDARAALMLEQMARRDAQARAA